MRRCPTTLSLLCRWILSKAVNQKRVDSVQVKFQDYLMEPIVRNPSFAFWHSCYLSPLKMEPSLLRNHTLDFLLPGHLSPITLLPSFPTLGPTERQNQSILYIYSAFNKNQVFNHVTKIPEQDHSPTQIRIKLEQPRLSE